MVRSPSRRTAECDLCHRFFVPNGLRLHMTACRRRQVMRQLFINRKTTGVHAFKPGSVRRQQERQNGPSLWKWGKLQHPPSSPRQGVVTEEDTSSKAPLLPKSEQNEEQIESENDDTDVPVAGVKGPAPLLRKNRKSSRIAESSNSIPVLNRAHEVTQSAPFPASSSPSMEDRNTTPALKMDDAKDNSSSKASDIRSNRQLPTTQNIKHERLIKPLNLQEGSLDGPTLYLGRHGQLASASTHPSQSPGVRARRPHRTAKAVYSRFPQDRITKSPLSISGNRWERLPTSAPTRNDKDRYNRLTLTSDGPVKTLFASSSSQSRALFPPLSAQGYVSRDPQPQGDGSNRYHPYGKINQRGGLVLPPTVPDPQQMNPSSSLLSGGQIYAPLVNSQDWTVASEPDSDIPLLHFSAPLQGSSFRSMGLKHTSERRSSDALRSYAPDVLSSIPQETLSTDKELLCQKLNEQVNNPSGYNCEAHAKDQEDLLLNRILEDEMEKKEKALKDETRPGPCAHPGQQASHIPVECESEQFGAQKVPLCAPQLVLNSVKDTPAAKDASALARLKREET